MAVKPAVGKLGKLAQVRKYISDKGLFSKNCFVELSADALKRPMPVISTGGMVLDHLIGGKPNKFGIQPCPGWPRGRLVNLYGYESSGKTTLALQTAAAVIQNGGEVLYIDYENEIDLKYAAALGIPIGVDNPPFMLAQPETMEEGMAIAYISAVAGIDLIVFDSVAAGIPSKTKDRKPEEIAEQGRIGLVASLWANFLPSFKAALNQHGSCCIGISQLRKNIAMTMAAGPDYTVQGGLAWRFYSSIRMILKNIGAEKTTLYDPITHKKIQMTTGRKIRARLDKCKVSDSMGHEVDFFIEFGKGIDNVRSIIEIAKSHKIITGSTWLQFELKNGEIIKVNGTDKLKQLLNAQPAVFEELKQLVFIRIQEANALESKKILGTEMVEDDGSESDSDFVDLTKDIDSILMGNGAGTDAAPAPEGDFVEGDFVDG
jgi:recombination protein RecA